MALGACCFGLKEFVEVAIVEQVGDGIADGALLDLALQALHFLGHGRESMAFGAEFA